MKRTFCFSLMIALSSLLPVAASARQVTIPRTRVRILYKDTGQPVEWVQLAISCWAPWRSKAEEKAYEEKTGGWHAEKETTLGGGRFLHAEDGWITIPEVSDVRMDSYQIKFDPAGGMTEYVVDPRRYHENPRKYYKLQVAYFDEKTFPKFAALPESERVLEAHFTKQCNIPSGTLNPTYEEGRFFLATYKIILDHWPELSAALGCGYGGDGPEFKGSYYGFLRYNCLLSMKGYIDPSYRLPGVKDDMTPAQRQDLLDRSRQLFCNDIKLKQARWKDSRVPLLDLDFFLDLHCECMGVQGLGPCEQAPPARAAPPSAKPSGPSPPTPPPSAPASP